MTIRFPITDLLDEQECYNFLLKTLHPNGLECKQGHPLPANQKPHDCSRAPIVDYRCAICGNVFNIFTNTGWQGSHTANKTPSNRKSKARLSRQRRLIRMRVAPTIGSLVPDGDIARSVIRWASMLVTMTAMASGKSIATQWKEFGQGCVPFCVPSEVFTKNIWLSM